jgi:SAM-dependent methyltransferase
LAESSNGYDPGYFPEADGCIEGSFWIKTRKYLFLWAMQKYFPQARSFMEIGCGTGLILSGFQQAFPDLTISGFEIFTKGLNFVPNRVPGAFVFQADARKIPFEKEFDTIGAFDVLEHIDEDVIVLEQMYQATKPGGGVLISVPQHPFLWSQRDECLHHKRRYTRKELIEKTHNAGFEIIQATSFVSLPFPGMLWDSFKHRKPNKNYNPLKGLQIGNLTNSALTSLLSIERQLIKSGLSFRFGGSLFLVAKRTS